ncbi:MAG: holo-ACP synthase [Thermoflavifilum sp.]|nr:holo-ACP synthase [Thermoflavifilum sp.]MCL6513691.1 holo-ACP synthase [Alicyclobacillus sp.]
MIFGLGCDAVELARIRAALGRRGDAFARRILADDEWQRYVRMAPDRKVEFVAGRFAAKEAIAKAAGCGLGRMGLHAVAIVEGTGGLRVVWHSGGTEGDPAWTDGRWHVAITHTRESAFAVAVWER